MGDSSRVKHASVVGTLSLTAWRVWHDVPYRPTKPGACPTCYRLIQVAFGGAASFVFTWVFFFVSTGGSMAILVVTFLQYAMAVVGDDVAYHCDELRCVAWNV